VSTVSPQRIKTRARAYTLRRDRRLHYSKASSLRVVVRRSRLTTVLYTTSVLPPPPTRHRPVAFWARIIRPFNFSNRLPPGRRPVYIFVDQSGCFYCRARHTCTVVSPRLYFVTRACPTRRRRTTTVARRGAPFGNVGKARRQCYLHKRDKRHDGRPFGDQLKWQTAPGRRHGDPESSSELVNRPLSSLTTSNVPLVPPVPLVTPLPPPGQPRAAAVARRRRRGLFCSPAEGNRILSPQNKPRPVPFCTRRRVFFSFFFLDVCVLTRRRRRRPEELDSIK